MICCRTDTEILGYVLETLCNTMCNEPLDEGMLEQGDTLKLTLLTTVNPVLLAAATNTVVCSRNEDENAKVGVRL